MRRPRIRASLLALAVVRLALPARASAQTSRPVLIAGRAGSGLRIDGRLDESAWSTADSIPNLTTTVPVEGGQPVRRTVVRVLVDVGTVQYANNHNMSTLDPTGNRRWQFDSSQLLVKVQYVFRY